MAIVVTADLAGGTAQLDESMRQKLNLGQNPAPGSLMRLAGPIEGGWRVVSVWESQEAFDRFRRERLEPALKESGASPPNFQFWTAESALVTTR
jgi:hypothetical protein